MKQQRKEGSGGSNVKKSIARRPRLTLIFASWVVVFSAIFGISIGSTSLAQTAGDIDGIELYLENCAICHGETGNGQGILAAQLEPRPRDFTVGSFRFRSSGIGDPPTEADLIQTISIGIEGSYGRSMPAFDQLTAEEIQRLATVVLELSGYNEFGQAIEIPARPEERQVELGRTLFVEWGCNQCHGDDGSGNGVLATTLTDDRGTPILPANLQATVFKGGNRPEDIWLRIQLGIDGTPMPSFGRNLSISESWALVDFVMELGSNE